MNWCCSDKRILLDRSVPTRTLLNFSVNLPGYLADSDKHCIVVNTAYGLFLHIVGCECFVSTTWRVGKIPDGGDGLHIPSKQSEREGSMRPFVTQEQLAVVASLFGEYFNPCFYFSSMSSIIFLL